MLPLQEPTAVALLVPAVARVRAGQQRRRCHVGGLVSSSCVASLMLVPLLPLPAPTFAPLPCQRPGCILRRSDANGCAGRTADCRGTTCVDGCATSYASILVCIGSNPSYIHIWMCNGSNPSPKDDVLWRPLRCRRRWSQRVHRHCGRLRTTVNASQLWEACRRCIKHFPSLPGPKAHWRHGNVGRTGS